MGEGPQATIDPRVLASCAWRSMSAWSRCLEVDAELTRRDRQRRRVFPFIVPDLATRLRVGFRYQPGEVDGIHNLLTISLFDPERFRGAAHRWDQSQTVIVDAGAATPGFVPGPLPSGRWQVELDAPEIVSDGRATGPCSLRIVVEVHHGPIPSQPTGTRDPWRLGTVAAAAGRGPRWYRGDLHSHSVHSDGDDTMAEMANAAASIGLDFRAATDHNTISQWLFDEPRSDGFLHIRGVECTTYFGHANVLGTSDWIDWRDVSVEDGARSILAQAAAQGAFAVVNHPSDRGYPVCTGCRWDFAPSDIQHFDAIEVWNGGWLDPATGNPEALALWTDQLMAGHTLTAVAGSDTHRASEYQRVDQPYTWVHAEALGEREILDGLRSGRAYLSCGPTLTFAARAAGDAVATLPGDRLPPGGFALRVDIARLAVPATLWLVADGSARRLGDVSPPGVTLQATATAGSWWRLELRGRGPDEPILTMTNPVYHGDRPAPEGGGRRFTRA
jgi:hypothetical protein